MIAFDLPAFEYTTARLDQAHDLVRKVNEGLRVALALEANGMAGHHGRPFDEVESLQRARSHLLDFIDKATAYQIAKLEERRTASAREPIPMARTSAAFAAVSAALAGAQ